LVGGLIFFGFLGSRLIGFLDPVSNVRLSEVQLEVDFAEPGRYTLWFDPIVGTVEPEDVTFTPPSGSGELSDEASTLVGVTLAVGETDRVAWVDVEVEEEGVHALEVSDSIVGSLVVGRAMPLQLLVALVIGGLLVGGLLLIGLVSTLVGASERRRHRRLVASVEGFQGWGDNGVRPDDAGIKRPSPPPGVVGRSEPWTGPASGSPPPRPPLQGPPVAPPAIPGPPPTALPDQPTDPTAPTGWSQPSRSPRLPGTDSPDELAKDTPTASGWSQPSRAPRLPPGFDEATAGDA